tara:strand:+ start:4306 stop:5100 length:795 start_codon:yes stop_codon:yes gene_type:complete
MRFVLGGIVTAGYMVWRGDSFRVSSKEILPLACLSLLFVVQIMLMNYGQYFTSAGHATALNATFPIWAAIFAHFIVPSDRLHRWKIVAIIFSYAGILAIVVGDTGFDGESADGETFFGDFMSLASAALLGLRLVLMSNFTQNMSEAKMLLSMLLVGILFFVTGSYIFENPIYSWDPRFWVALFYQGVVIAGFGFLSNAWLVKRYLPSTVTFFNFIQPAAGVTLAWIVLGEDPGSGLLLGLLLIVIGALVHGGEAFLKARKASVH